MVGAAVDSRRCSRSTRTSSASSSTRSGCGCSSRFAPGESNVSKLRDALELDSSATSQHLAALRTQGLVASRRQGTSVYYRLRDPLTLMLLDISQQMALATIEEDGGNQRGQGDQPAGYLHLRARDQPQRRTTPAASGEE